MTAATPYLRHMRNDRRRGVPGSRGRQGVRGCGTWLVLGGAAELFATPASDGITVTNTVPAFRVSSEAAARLTVLDLDGTVAARSRPAATSAEGRCVPRPIR